MEPMTIDCTTCPVRDVRCDTCMVTALLAIRPVEARDQVMDGVDLVVPAHQVLYDPDPPAASGELAWDDRDRACVDRFVASGLLTPDGVREVRVVAERSAWREAAG